MELPHLKSLLRQWAPELSGAPLYIVHHPAHLPAPLGADAFACNSIDAVWRKHLIERGEWQRQGRLISFINTEPRDVLAVALHEAGHLLPALELPEDDEPTEQQYAERLDLLEQESVTPPKLAEIAPRWFPHHGQEWVRICVHLWWRAALSGHVVSRTAMTVAGYHYDLSSAEDYFTALGTEPQRMRGATFQDIVSNDAPEAFAELWKGDLAACAERQRKQKLSQNRREGKTWHC